MSGHGSDEEPEPPMPKPGGGRKRREAFSNEVIFFYLISI